MELLGEYGSDSEGEETKQDTSSSTPQRKSALFSSLPPPSSSSEPSKDENQSKENGDTEKSASGSGKRKLHTFTVPVNPLVTKKTKEEEIEEDAGEQPKAKAARRSGVLSFLPAPSNAEEPKSTKTSSLPYAFDQSPSTTGKKSSTSSARRIPMSFQHRIVEQKEEKESEQEKESQHQESESVGETNGENGEEQQPPPPEHSGEYSQDYSQDYSQEYAQEYAAYYSQYYNYDPSAYAAYGVTDPYPGGSQTPSQALPTQTSASHSFENLPREFRGLAQGAQIREVRMDEVKRQMRRYQEPVESRDSGFKSSGTFIPDRMQRKQNSIQYLLYDMQRKAADLQEQRSASAKAKRESRSKYGW